MRGFTARCLRLGVLAGLTAACGDEQGPARAQWVVSVETDAPVPQLGDRLLLQVFHGKSACESCSRHLAAADPEAWPISFGVLPAANVSVQATLFRAAMIRQDGLPEGDALLQARARLPESSGVSEVSLRLSMDCFGVRADAAGRRSCDPASRQLVPEPEATDTIEQEGLAVGSWPAAQTEPCASEPPEGMVCVSGGVFVLGEVSATLVATSSEQPVPERLVRVSPFFLDTHELSVGRARDLLAGLPLLDEPEQGGACTYLGLHSDRNDPQPLNCVTRPLAQALCEAQGKTLPSEAQWEYAAVNLARETPYPWGHDDDVCAHAVVARATDIGQCRVTADGTLPPGVQDVGSSADMTELGIFDLAGNVSEWLADDFEGYAAECRQSPDAALNDAPCRGSGNLAAVRGGNWAVRPDSATSVRRSSAAPDASSTQIGVRCAQQP